MEPQLLTLMVVMAISKALFEPDPRWRKSCDMTMNWSFKYKSDFGLDWRMTFRMLKPKFDLNTQHKSETIWYHSNYFSPYQTASISCLHSDKIRNSEMKVMLLMCLNYTFHTKRFIRTLSVRCAISLSPLSSRLTGRIVIFKFVYDLIFI